MIHLDVAGDRNNALQPHANIVDTQLTALSAAAESVITESMTEMVAVSDVNRRITMMNRAMAAAVGLAGTSSDAGSADTVWTHRHIDGRAFASADLPLSRALLGESVVDEEMTVTWVGGRRQNVIVNATTLYDGEAQILGAVVMMRDITQQREAEAKLAFQKLHDGLTGLPGRILFMQRVQRALDRGARHRWSTAVLAVNIDGFDSINLQFGHEAGDQILRQVAERLRACIRASDAISRETHNVARLGADQFFVLCEQVGGARGAAGMAARVAKLFERPILAADEPVQISVHVGIRVARGAKHNPEVLMREARSALRRARETGIGHTAFFEEELRSVQAARFDDEHALRTALERGELRVAFQPKISLATDRIVGVEALLRWDHPLRGPIPPSSFIPLAEATGMIVPIGAWVLSQACQEGARWQRLSQGRSAPIVSVNISARQFDSSLLTTLRTVLAETGMDAAHLCLEVTESMVMGDPEVAIAMLHQIKALGVLISMDDFGTGYSSLAYLRRFPLTELKIDKSFVDGLGRDPESTAIVAAVMGMAHAMDLNVVAEGVETSAQLDALRALGCDEAQGYYYARPQAADRIDELMTKPRLDGDRARAPRPEGTADWGSGTVVIVDDAPEVRLHARMSLTAAGFGVHEAESGESAIDLIRRVRPDCVLLDMHMPGMSGLDVCRVLRADATTRDVTVVMLTADGKAAEKAEAFALEADDYIVKPFVPRDLVSRITAAIRRREEAGEDGMVRPAADSSLQRPPTGLLVRLAPQP
jgi:diguanylate cyclase (GGDEF)-like protein/PAS domain S-box-containing protein